MPPQCSEHSGSPSRSLWQSRFYRTGGTPPLERSYSRRRQGQPNFSPRRCGLVEVGWLRRPVLVPWVSWLLDREVRPSAVPTLAASVQTVALVVEFLRPLGAGGDPLGQGPPEN